MKHGRIWRVGKYLGVLHLGIEEETNINTIEDIIPIKDSTKLVNQWYRRIPIPSRRYRRIPIPLEKDNNKKKINFDLTEPVKGDQNVSYVFIDKRKIKSIEHRK